MRRRRLMLPLVLAALATVTPLEAQDVGLPLGSVPEAVQLQDLEGNTVDLTRYVGNKPVIIQFWATWCPLCEALEPKLAAAKRQHGDALDVVIVAVGVNQSVRSIRKHLASHTLTGPVYFDGRGRAVRAFKAPSTSYVVALDRRGRVVYTGVGADQDIAAAAARAVAAR